MITLQANLTNRDATRLPHPFVKWSYEPARAAGRARPLWARATHTRDAAPARAGVRLDSDGRLGRPRRTPTAMPQAIERSVAAAPAPTPRRSARSPRGSRRPKAPVLVVGPDVDASGAWDAAVALAERQRLPVWATPAPGGGRIGFPEGHPNFRGTLPPAIGPLGEMLAGHDLVLVVGQLGVPLLPLHPRPPAAGGHRPRADHQRPRRGRRGPRWARRSSPTSGSRSRRSSARCRSPIAPPPSRSAPPEAPAGVRPPEPLVRSTRRSARRFPDDGIVVLESPSSTMALRNQLRLSRPGATTSAPAAASGSAWPAAVGRPARRAEPPGRLRDRRGLGAVRGDRALVGGRIRRPGHLPRASKRGVLDPQVVRRPRGGLGRPGPRPALPGHGGDSRRLRVEVANGREGSTSSARSCRRRSPQSRPS